MPGYLASCVRAARLRAGYTQETLAALAGIARPNIVRIESGRHGVSEKQLESIAGALGLTMAQLVTHQPEPGEAITCGLCPCCGADLTIEYGSDEGEVAIYGTR